MTVWKIQCVRQNNARLGQHPVPDWYISARLGPPGIVWANNGGIIPGDAARAGEQTSINCIVSCVSSCPGVQESGWSNGAHFREADKSGASEVITFPPQTLRVTIYLVRNYIRAHTFYKHG